MQITKRLLRFVALASVILGAGCLAMCIKFYVEDSFLKPGATIDPNPKVIGGMIGMIRSGYFGIIPAMSVLLFVCSFLLWFASKKFSSDK
jgi:hypothetical protein